jgi:hypothetical protein
LRVLHTGLTSERLWSKRLLPCASTGVTGGPPLRSPAANTPDTTPTPVPLSEPACTAWSGPHLSRPRRGPRRHSGEHRRLPLRLWGRETGRPWPCWPRPPGPTGPADLHSTPGYRAVATGAAEGSRPQAFRARGAQRADEPPRAGRRPPGDGPHRVAQPGARGWATQAPNPRRARKASPARPTRALSGRPARGRPSGRRPGPGGRRV